MVPEPYGSSRVAVAIASLLLSLGLLPVIKYRFIQISLAAIPFEIVNQFVDDMSLRNRWAVYWSGLLMWSVVVTTLHFRGRATGMYLQYQWWDILTHTMSGTGVAGVLLIGLREVLPPRPPVSLVVVLLLSIGAGFEVYEYVFKSFWHTWTFSEYVQDTVIDLLMGCVGGAVALAHYHLRMPVTNERPARIDHPQPND